MPVQPPIYTPRLPMHSGGVTVLPPDEPKAQQAANVIQGLLMGILQGKEMKYQRGLEQKKFGLEKALRESQIAYNLARSQEGPSGSDELNALRASILKGMSPEEQKSYLLKPSTKVETNVNLPSMEKSTKGAIERDIIDLRKQRALVEHALSTFEDEFLTIGGKAWGKAQRAGDVLGAPSILGTDYIKDKAAWMANAMPAFLEYRKYITGVAANPAEKGEIAEAMPDPKKNSPAEFRAKAQELLRIGRMMEARLEYLIEKGITDPSADDLSKYPLSRFAPKESATKQEQADLTGIPIGLPKLPEVPRIGPTRRIRVIGPNGERGTMNEGELSQYPGWRRAE